MGSCKCFAVPLVLATAAGAESVSTPGMAPGSAAAVVGGRRGYPETGVLAAAESSGSPATALVTPAAVDAAWQWAVGVGAAPTGSRAGPFADGPSVAAPAASDSAWQSAGSSGGGLYSVDVVASRRM